MVFPVRLLLAVPLLAWLGNAHALGLGKITVFSSLGEPLRAEVEVFYSGKDFIDSTCFQLRRPQGEGDLPWIQRGTVKLRPGVSPVVEIRTTRPVSEPVIQVGIVASCGYEVLRDFTLLLSPPEQEGKGGSAPAAVEAPRVARPASPAPPPRQQKPLAPYGEAGVPARASEWSPPPVARPRREKPPAQSLLRNRVVVSGNSESDGIPSLRMATELTGGTGDSDAAREVQRSILRMEFRMMMALQELTASQATSAEKLRTLQSVLEVPALPSENAAPKPDSGEGVSSTAAAGVSKPASVAAAPPVPAPPVPAKASAGDNIYEWVFYGGLLAALLVIGTWLAWRQYRARQAALEDISSFPPSFEADLPDERKEPQQAFADDFDDHPVRAEPRLPEDHGEITDIEVIDPRDTEPAAAAPEPPAMEADVDAIPSIEQQFDAQPVLELADIMMSFGRAKGAAQVLQEYIEQKPKEALQPWLRLMEVYRQAGMREEFERLVEDFHQHFNVEVQRWNQLHPEAEAAPGFSLELVLPGEAPASPAAPAKAQSLEDFGHIRDKLVDTWRTPECLTYLHHLLRDNRGGQRAGFPLPVVNEILCLIELLETQDQEGPRELAPLPFE